MQPINKFHKRNLPPMMSMENTILEIPFIPNYYKHCKRKKSPIYKNTIYNNNFK